MKKIGSLILAVAVLFPAGAALAADSGETVQVSATQVEEPVVIDDGGKDKKLTPGFIQRAESLCEDLMEEYSLSFIPKTLCFYLLQQQHDKNDDPTVLN